MTASVQESSAGPIVALVNGACALTRHVGLDIPRPDADALLRAAHARTGLPGSDTALEPLLRSAVRSADAGGQLTAFGRWGVRKVASRMLDNRLRIADLLARQPDILALPVERPVLVTGWYRSGTTLLHRLLTLAGEVRSPRAFELYFPLRAGCDPRTDEAQRIAAMRRMIVLARLAIPGLADLHPLDALEAEEASVLLDNEGVGVYFLHAFGAHQHGRALLTADLGPAYASLRRQLQLLQYAGGRGRWVLKCPFSQVRIDDVLRVMPDVAIVHIHRDPREALASVCSLAAILQRAFLRRVDLEAIGAFWFEFFLAGARRMAEVRHTLGPDRLVEVGYRSLIADPVGVTAAIQERLGMAARSGPAGPATGHGRPPVQGRHNHSLAPFGLSEERVMAELSPFLREDDALRRT